MIYPGSSRRIFFIDYLFAFGFCRPLPGEGSSQIESSMPLLTCVMAFSHVISQLLVALLTFSFIGGRCVGNLEASKTERGQVVVGREPF